MELSHTAVRAGRLSSFLREELGLSYGLMNRLKWQDKLYVNGIPRHADYPIAIGDVITVPLEEPKPDYPAQDGDLTILYEDDHILAVDKPAGMLIHPSRSQFDGTLANLVVGHYQATGQRSAFHPVTRLDRDTFGVVLLAKNSHVHQLLQATAVRKVYHALVLDGPREDAGVIDAPIARRPLPSLLRYVGPEGKPSVTEFQVLARDGALCKLELRPVTGRTHQLRVHCAYMGFPILGDPQYHNERSRKLSAAMELDSQLLCARELRFVHPMTGEDMVLVSRMEVK